MNYYKDTQGTEKTDPKRRILPIAAAVVAAVIFCVCVAVLAGGKKPAQDRTTVPVSETAAPVTEPGPAGATDASFAPDKEGEVTFDYLPGGLDDAGAATDDPGKVHTAAFTIPNRILRLEIVSGWRLEAVCFVPEGGTVRSVYTGPALLYARRNAKWAFVLSREDGAAVTPSDAANARVFLLLSDDYAAGSGVQPAGLIWAPNADFAACFPLQAGERISAPVSLAHAGLGISPSAEAADAGFRVAVGRLTDDGIVPAEEALYSALNASLSPVRKSLYLPETADTFAFLIAGTEARSGLRVTRGTPGTEGTSRLPGLWYTSLVLSGTGADASIRAESFNVYTMSKDLETYAALLPVGEIRRITCCPEFELIVLAYSVKNGTLTKTGTLWRGVSPDGTVPMGVDTVEAADLGGAEWALILIHRRAAPEISDGKLRVAVPGMGGMNRFDAVYAGVRVETVSALTVSDDMDPTLALNLTMMRSITIPETDPGLFRTPSSKQTYAFSAFTNTSPWWYGGTALANSPLVNVSIRSLFTAAKNPNSRFYMQAWGSEPVYLTYGLNCAKFINTIFGSSDFFNAETLVYGPISYVDRSTFSFPADLDSLRPGDLLAYYRDDFSGGHVILVQDMVYLGDALYCVNIVESFPPYARQRTLYVGLPAAFAASSSGLLSSFPAEDLARYPHRIRVKEGYARPISVFCDLNPDDSVGTVMADRGSDAVYCLGTKLLELSVSDKAAKTLSVYREGAFAFSVSLENAETKNGLRVADIAAQITEPGLYTVKTDRSDAVQERFYVPPALPKPVYEYSADTPGPNATVRVGFPDYAHLESVSCYYAWKNPKTGKPSSRPITYSLSLVTAGADGWGRFTAPYQLDGKTFVGAVGLYRTAYGTFWLDEARQSAENEIQFLSERIRRAAYPPK